MECPACRSPFQPGDRFCGNCGERLPDASPGGMRPPMAAPAAPPPMSAPAQAAQPPMSAPPAPAPQQMPPQPAGQPVMAQPPMAAPPGIAAAAVEVRDPGAMPAMTCPVCASMIPAGAARCPICYYERDASAGAGAAPGMEPAASSTGITSAMICPTHGPLDPSWTRCPYCLREGRDSRVSSRPVDSGLPSAPIPSRNSMIAPLSPPAAPPPGVQAQPAAMQAQPPAAPPQAPPAAQQPPAASRPPAGPPPAVSQARPGPASPADRPASSVGATFAIRRLPRVLAYLIEKEGEAVGRVHQLEDSVTDLGRDPRNHIVLSDASISGFHARLERGPDGNFVITDHGSTNGSFLNGERVTTARMLQENDELRLGSTTLVLKIVM